MKWHFSNVIVKGCWELGNHILRSKQALGELLILIHRSTCRDSIYRKEKARKRFFDGSANREDGKGLVVYLSDSSFLNYILDGKIIIGNLSP